MRYGRHAGPVGVRGICDVVDGGSPVQKVRGDLMHEFLSIQGIPLVGVVANDLALVVHEKGFPDRRDPIIWDCGTT